jgi:hypothetical protein
MNMRTIVLTLLAVAAFMLLRRGKAMRSTPIPGAPNSTDGSGVF